jgi:hypothetical protein
MANGGDQPTDLRSQLHDAIYGVLIEKVRADRYPSTTMMDFVENAALDERQLRAYSQVLLEKVTNDRFPSIDMIRRLISLL